MTTPLPRFCPQININVPQHYVGILEKYKDYSMVDQNPQLFIENLLLMDFFGKYITGDFVECGTWKGGMSCAMMAVGGTNRNYHFFDSFEGLPDAKELDGLAAIQYQKDVHSPYYRDNCNADHQEFLDLIYAQDAPKEQISVYKGWFEDRLPDFPGSPISVLRLDGDWYESTRTCLKQLYRYITEGGIIILDDYDAWDGCARAVHDYLSETGTPARIQRTPLMQIAYLQKFSS